MQLWLCLAFTQSHIQIQDTWEVFFTDSYMLPQLVIFLSADLSYLVFCSLFPSLFPFLFFIALNTLKNRVQQQFSARQLVSITPSTSDISKGSVFSLALTLCTTITNDSENVSFSPSTGSIIRAFINLHPVSTIRLVFSETQGHISLLQLALHHSAPTYAFQLLHSKKKQKNPQKISTGCPLPRFYKRYTSL